MDAQVIGAKPILLPIARLLDAMFWGHPVLLLFFVMIMCPLTMNVAQVRTLEQLRPLLEAIASC
jgi:hypothetical protein